MRRWSAGILMFRRRGQHLEVFLVHPGGPFWQKKEIGAWSIPKGEYLDGEDELAAAKREFEEETGIKPEGEFIPLGKVTQPGGKVVTAWALEGDCSTTIRSNTFSMEWPPKSGQTQEFPEVDRANWFRLEICSKSVKRAASWDLLQGGLKNFYEHKDRGCLNMRNTFAWLCLAFCLAAASIFRTQRSPRDVAPEATLSTDASSPSSYKN